MSESESALESDDEEQGLTVVPSSKAKRGARAGLGGGAAAGRSDKCNEAAILRKLEQLRGGVDTESNDAAWLETLDITASEPVELDDAEEGQRELAFYTQALAAVKAAQARLTKMDVPFARPDDYFAEMLKTDQHMAKVKLRLIKQQEAVFNAEQRRQPQHHTNPDPGPGPSPDRTNPDPGPEPSPDPGPSSRPSPSPGPGPSPVSGPRPSPDPYPNAKRDTAAPQEP